MIDTFKWPTQVSPTATDTINLYTAQFSDGYQQVAVNGINNIAEQWDLTWTGKKKDVAAIRTFLHSHPSSILLVVESVGGEKLYRVKPESIKPTFVSGKVVTLGFSFKRSALRRNR
jgi:phage-related protein